MKTAVVTDSNSGIFEQEADSLGVYVVPMPVILNGVACFEGVDLMPEDFYQALAAHAGCSTSQPAPDAVTSAWDRALEDGFEEVVYIPMSSGLSNSCQTARGLAESYGGRVQVADNRRISVTQRQSVLDALTLARQNLDAREIRRRLEAAAMDSMIYVGVETMEYLRRGGRVTPAAAAMASVLNLKPLLLIRGEQLDACAKVRGTRNCRQRLLQEMQRCAQQMMADGLTELQIGAAGSFVTPGEHREWAQMVRDAFPGQEVLYDPLTISVACHVGPGAFGMGISARLR